jgi:hypothetical protein
MGADLRAKGLASDPADVLHIEATVQPNQNSNATEIIDSWDAPKQLVELNQEEVAPPRRGPGRPPGSKNKPKVVDERPRGVPGFDLND